MEFRRVLFQSVQLRGLIDSIKKFGTDLAKQFGNPGKWMKPSYNEYIISDDIVPTFAQMQNVTVKIVSVSVKVESATNSLTTDLQNVGSGSFSLRMYAR